MRFVLRASVCCGLVSIVAACGATKPSLRASSDRQGALTITGSHWHTCGAIRVALPPPWGSSTVHGSTFSLAYPVPLVKPYAGHVVATQSACNGEAALTKSATIAVGDYRANP